MGLDGYKEAMKLADIVFLATPPGFRPMHFEEAIRQNKHVFMEKPLAVDGPGVRKVLAAAEKAKLKKLNVTIVGFADDAALIATGTHIGPIIKRLNQALRYTKEWADEQSLELSKEKTCAILFTRKRKLNIKCTYNIR